MVQPNSTRSEDWARFWAALTGATEKHRTGIWLVLHTGKNIIVEEARRWGIELRPSKWFVH